MARLSIQLLGTFSVAIDRQEARGFDSDKARALLAYLVMEAGRPHRRDKLAGLLWSEQPEGRAHASLSQALYNLRHVLGDRTAPVPCLIVDHQTVQLNPQCEPWVDARLFSELIGMRERHSHAHPETCPDCATILGQIAEVYRGGFLEGFSLAGAVGFEEWSLLTRERLHQQALGALMDLADYHEGRGEITQALGVARRCVQIDPLWEPGQRSLMRILALDGQTKAALAQYQKFRRLLANELGLEPDRETAALAERLRREAEGLPPVDHLPAALTPFVGRWAELIELGALLRDPACRLVTVLGAGGSGKTRLALQVARAARYDFADGVHLAPLSALSSADELPAAVAAAIGFTFREGGDHRAQLLDFLRGRRALLVLDSFETVLDGAGWLVELLRHAAGVKALVTSRARLNVKTEHVYPLAGMRYPPGDDLREARRYSAVQLFVSGAERAYPGFRLEDGLLPEAVRICQRVSGMPLGLLLASAWVETMPLGEIAAQIERSLDFLSVEWQDVPERQRSLRATFEYSWRLLRGEQQQALAGLSVFRGSLTSQAAWQVAGATAQDLRGLSEKSMLQGVSGGRYQMHDLLRQFAGEKLAQDEARQRTAHQRHRDCYVEKLASWREDLTGARQVEALLEMDVEVVDARLACRRATSNGDWLKLERAIEGLGRFYELRCRYAEGESAYREMLEAAELPALRAWLQAWQAVFKRRQGKLAAAGELLEEAQTWLRRDGRGAASLRLQALIWLEQGLLEKNLDTKEMLIRDSLELFRKAGEPHWVAVVLCELEKVSSANGDLEGGRIAASEAVTIMRQLGERRGIANSLNRLSYWHSTHGYFEQALAEMQEANELYYSLGDRFGWAEGTRHLGIMLGWNGRFAEGSELVERSLQVYRELGERRAVAYCTLALSLSSLLQGNYADANRQGCEALELSRLGGFQSDEANSLWSIGCARLGQGDFGPALGLLEEGAALSRRLPDPDLLGMALGGLSLAYHCNGQPQQALDNLCAALRLALKVKGAFTLVSGLPAAASLLVEAGLAEKAVEVCALARRKPCIYNSTWFEDIAGRRVDERAVGLTLQVLEAAKQRGREADPYELLAEVLEALGCGAR